MALLDIVRRQAGPTPWSERAAVGACVVLYLALSVACGQVWEPTHDEGVTWFQVLGRLPLARWPAEPTPVTSSYAVLDGGHSRSAADVIDALTTGTGMHPPAYYLLLHWWVGLVGSGRMLLALPAHLWGVLTLLGLHRLANRVVPGHRAGLWAMLLLAVSPWFMGFSNLARPYALALCLAVWSLDVALALHRETPGEHARLGPRVAFVALSTAGLYVIYHYAFVLIWELALLLGLAWRLEPARRWRELRNLAGMGLAITLGFAPWVPRVLAHLELTGRSAHYFAGHVAPPEWLSATGQLLALFALAEAVRSPAVEVMLPALLLLSLCTLLLFLASLLSPWRGSLDAVSSAFWISIPLLPAFIIASDLWRDTHTIFITKTCFAFLPILILMVVRGWQHVSIPSVRRAGLGAWALLLGAASLSAIHVEATSVIPYEAAARHVRQRDTDAHLVVLSSPRYSCATPLLLSLRDAGVRHVRLTTVSGDRLVDLVRSATRSGEFTDVSLIALDVSCFTKRIWQQAALRRAEAQARESQWRVIQPGPSGIPRAPPGGPPAVWILGPLQVKSFSM